jgi:hypothetical protein
LPSSAFRKSTNAVVVRDQWAPQADGRSNQQAVGRIAMVEITQVVSKRGSLAIERYRLQPGFADEPIHPACHWQIEFDEAFVHEERDFPCADSAEEYAAK